jgi:hypothetical protein
VHIWDCPDAPAGQPVCGYARAQYDDNRNRAIAYGTWQPWVDAEPVRIHIGYLSCDMRLRAIAAAADQGPAGTRRRGPGRRAHLGEPGTVHADQPAWNPWRAHSLVAVGWPQQHLAVRLNVLAGNFGQMLARDHVLVSRALAVRSLYDELWNADPAKYGATAARIARARKYAAAYGWAPVGAWDDDTIDDPEAVPNWTGQCGTPEGFWAHRYIDVLPCPPCRDAFNAERKQTRRGARG